MRGRYMYIQLQWQTSSVETQHCSGGSRGAGGPCPPSVGGLKNFFASILILLLSRLHTMDRGNTKVLFVEGLYFPTGLCLPPFAVSVLCIGCRLQQQVL